MLAYTFHMAGRTKEKKIIYIIGYEVEEVGVKEHVGEGEEVLETGIRLRQGTVRCPQQSWKDKGEENKN